MNDVRTKKMRTYNFVNGPARPVSPPLARAGYRPMRDKPF